MSKRIRIIPYHRASMSVWGLVEAIPNALIVKLQNSRYRYRPGDVLINWGNSHEVVPGTIPLNRPEAVKLATSKMRTYDALKLAGVQTVKYTTDINEARGWDCRIVGRNLDRGFGGHGITVFRRGEPLTPQRFYCKYVRKEREFRFHVFTGRVIFVQEKLKKKGVEDADPYVRSHARGWCFAFKHLDEKPAPDGLAQLAINAVAALGLDFGAVDLSWSARSGGTVFEVNTAPGIEESSLSSYVEAINAL